MTSLLDSSLKVLECFDELLPELRREELRYKAVKPSSTTTAAAIPPLVLLCKRDDIFRDKAKECLKRERERKIISSFEPLGVIFKQITLNSEADLVMASTLYLIKPILSVLQDLYGEESFTVTSEQTMKSDVLEGDDKATRVDLVIRSTSGSRKAILILEYKRREQIKYSNFQEALLSIDTPEDTIEEKKEDVLASGKFTFLEDNALSYTKQCATYASQAKCKHVSLLNWDHLLLFEFDELEHASATATTAGEAAKLTWVLENHTPGQYVNRGKMRMALLGFVLQAFEEHGMKKISV